MIVEESDVEAVAVKELVTLKLTDEEPVVIPDVVFDELMVVLPDVDSEVMGVVVDEKDADVLTVVSKLVVLVRLAL